MNIVDRIREAGKEQGFTLAEIERTLGFSNSSIRKWSQNSPSLDKVIAIAKLLGKSLDWLATGYIAPENIPFSKLSQDYERLSEAEKDKLNNYIEICLLKKTPHIYTYEPIIEPYPSMVAETATPYMTRSNKLLAILGYVAAGKPIEGISIPLGYIASPVNDANYVLIAKGSSMEPVILDGEYIYVKNSQNLNYGDIGIFYIDGDVTCKMYCPQQDVLILRSLNPNYEPFKYSLKNELHEFKIQGKVVLTAEQQQRLSK